MSWVNSPLASPLPPFSGRSARGCRQSSTSLLRSSPHRSSSSCCPAPAPGKEPVACQHPGCKAHPSPVLPFHKERGTGGCNEPSKRPHRASRGPPSYSQRGWIGGSPPIFHPSWRPLPLTGGGQGIRVGTDAVSGHSKPRTLRRYLGWEKLSATLAKGGRVHLPLFRRSSNVYVSRFRYTRKM